VRELAEQHHPTVTEKKLEQQLMSTR
jgi:hypothetical protein